MKLPIEVKLKRPIAVDGQECSVLLFDEPSIGAQIDYAELEAELGLSELRQKMAAETDLAAQAEIIPPTVSMRVTQFWIEALAELPKGAARKIKASDHAAVHAAVDAILDAQKDEGSTPDMVGNGDPKT